MENEIIDISENALWTVSTYKPGYPLANLRDSDETTFWQSEGKIPHFIQAEFPHIVKISMVSIYLDYEMDDSYTPEKFVLQAGFDSFALNNVIDVELVEPKGYINMYTTNNNTQYIEASSIRICILSNSQGGNESRVRNISVYSPSSGSDSDEAYNYNSKESDTDIDFFYAR